jgi:hypothetical protein
LSMKKAQQNAAFRQYTLKHGHHSGYRNQPLNMRMRVCYLVMYLGNLWRQLYYRLWLIYWLSLVVQHVWTARPAYWRWDGVNPIRKDCRWEYAQNHCPE